MYTAATKAENEAEDEALIAAYKYIFEKKDLMNDNPTKPRLTAAVVKFHYISVQYVHISYN